MSKSVNYNHKYQEVIYDDVLIPNGLSVINGATKIVLPDGLNNTVKLIQLINYFQPVELYYNITEKMILDYNKNYTKLVCLNNKWILVV
jgi:hypothetical protein